nr:Conserved hypothetical protein [uncultured bacterium]
MLHRTVKYYNSETSQIQIAYLEFWPSAAAGALLAGATAGALAAGATGADAAGTLAGTVAGALTGTSDLVTGLSNNAAPPAAWRFAPIEVKASVDAKNIVAAIAVDLVKKLDEPVAPNKLPDAPEPKAAPISAPLPCCNKTKPTITSADKTCTTTMIAYIEFIA